MRRVMIDIEALGNDYGRACIVQLAGKDFDGERSINLYIDWKNAVACNGAMIDPDTLTWWLTQPAETIDHVLRAKDKTFERDAFHQFNLYLQGANEIWSHATYDAVMITARMRTLALKPLFGFRSFRDIRTLLALSPETNPKERKGMHHDALADCDFQIDYVKDALSRLGFPMYIEAKLEIKS